MANLGDFFSLVAEEEKKKKIELENKLQKALAEQEVIGTLSKLMSQLSENKPEIPEVEVVVEQVEVPTVVELVEVDLGLIGGTTTTKTADPITPLDQKFVTFDDLQNHYKTYIARIQQQMSTMGGGGEVNLRYLDDVNRTSIADGQNMQYNGATKKFEFTRPIVTAYPLVSSNTEMLVENSTPSTISGMSISPPAGTYIANFNSKYTVVDTSSITLQAKELVIALYADLSTRSATGTETIRTPNSATYSNETVGPGVYIHTAALTFNNTITLDASGNTAAEFIFVTAGAFTTGAGAEIILTGGATSSNVWIVSAGAPSTGVNTTFRGNFIANQAAPSLGAPTSFEGRIFSVNGAIAIGEACIITAPSGTSTTPLGTLAAFNLFAGTGAVSNTGAVTTVALSIGSNAGAITGFPEGNVGGSIIVGNGEVSRVRIGVYVGGVLIPDSRRSYEHAFTSIDDEFAIILQTVATIVEGQSIEIKASVVFGEVTIGPRMSLILTLIQ